MSKSVREPIQVYLTAQERDVLDRCAAELGVSRSEVLRRGLRAVGEPSASGAYEEPLEAGSLTSASSAPGPPPPSLPVATLRDLLEELDEDRRER